MQIAVTFVLVFLAACGSASARVFGGDQLVSPQAKQMYQQWEHAAVHTSRSLMMSQAMSPAAPPPPFKCPKIDVWLYEDSVCQQQGGNNISMTISPGGCKPVKDLIKDLKNWGVSAYKYDYLPLPELPLHFFTTSDCTGDYSMGLEGLAGMEDACPAIKGNNHVDGWNYGSFKWLRTDLTKFSFNQKIKSIGYDCTSTSTSSAA